MLTGENQNILSFIISVCPGGLDAAVMKPVVRPTSKHQKELNITQRGGMAVGCCAKPLQEAPAPDPAEQKNLLGLTLAGAEAFTRLLLHSGFMKCLHSHTPFLYSCASSAAVWKRSL